MHNNHKRFAGLVQWLSKGGGKFKICPGWQTLAIQLQMNKQLKLINDFYYCRPGKGALSSNTCLFYRWTKKFLRSEIAYA